MTYTKIEIPKELSDKALEVIEIAKNTGKIKKGMNEATKAIEREKAKLVVVANDINPPEIVMHIPPLCEEKKIPYIYIPSKKQLGDAAGIDVSAAAIAIINPGKANDQVKEVVEKLNALK